MKLTVFTPTYNRAETLLRLYDSLKKQNSTEWEWLIIDDGSSDSTSEIITDILRDATIRIRYIKQENGGKHRAYNHALKEANGQYFLCVDSDDYLAKNAIDYIIRCVNSLNEKTGIICYKQEKNGRLLCDKFPKEVEMCSKLQLEQEYHCYGEFTLIFPTKIARNYPFPEFVGEKFVTEAVVYDQIDEECSMYLLPQAITICEYQEDGYSNNFNKIMKNNPAGYCLYFMQRIDLQNDFKKRIVTAGKYHCFCIFAKIQKSKYVGAHKMLVALTKPLGLLFWMYYKVCRGF